MSLDYRIIAHPDFRHLAKFILDVTAHGLPDDSIEVYKSRNRIVWCSRDNVDINIKSFRLPNIVNRYVYASLRKSKAERSYLNALRLISLGFSTPQPIGFGEEYSPGRLRHSYYFSVQIKGEEMRCMERRPDCREQLNALGREMAGLHRAGVWMKDFSPGNVLSHRNSDGSYTFNYVDLNRIEFDCHKRSRLMQMFGAMVYTPEHLRMLSDGYAEAMGIDPDKAFADALESMKAFNRRKTRKKFLKKLFK